MTTRMNLRRLLCLILSAFLLLPALACADSGNSGEGQTAPPSGSDETPEMPEAEETRKYLDSLPETMDYGGYEITFLSSEENKSIELDEAEDDTGDVVNDAYWKRNTALEERMNVKLVLGEKTGYGSFNAAATQAITSGSDEYDLFCGHTRFNVSLAASGYLVDLGDNNLTSILDIDAPYWSRLFIDNINYKDNLYWLAGDMTHNFIAYIYAMFVNATVWNDYYSGTSLYDTVLEGTWTLDKLNEFSSGTYRDVNGNSELDDNDAYGVIMQKGHVLNGMVFAAGVTYTGVDADGNYEVILGSENTVDAFNKLHALFYSTDYGRMLANEAFDTTCVTMFTQDRLLFCPNTFGYAGNEKIRDMESDFYIIPLPKKDDQQESYRVNQYDGVPLYGIPTTVPTDRQEMVATVLEADCSMTSKIVIPAYYDLALKNKYSRDATTAQMIDLIHDNITADFCFYWGDSLGSLMNFFYDNIQNDEIASKFKSNEKMWAKTLSKLVAKLEG